MKHRSFMQNLEFPECAVEMLPWSNIPIATCSSKDLAHTHYSGVYISFRFHKGFEPGGGGGSELTYSALIVTSLYIGTQLLWYKSVWNLGGPLGGVNPCRFIAEWKCMLKKLPIIVGGITQLSKLMPGCLQLFYAFFRHNSEHIWHKSKCVCVFVYVCAIHKWQLHCVIGYLKKLNNAGQKSLSLVTDFCSLHPIPHAFGC